MFLGEARGQLNDSLVMEAKESNDFVLEGAFCGRSLRHFQQVFSSFYGYLSLCVCFFGAVSNVINVVVLTRREMRSSTNTILTGLAVADLMVMLEYVPFSLHSYVLHFRTQSAKYTYRWAAFVLFHAHFTQLFHTISIWLTVTLAVWRCVYVRFPRSVARLCSSSRAAMTVASAYLLPPILCLPVFLSLRIEELKNSRGETLYLVRGVGESDSMRMALFWTYGVAVKLVPCALLTGLMGYLIATICAAHRKRKSLMSFRKSRPIPSAAAKGAGGSLSSDGHRDRTTTMLVGILMLFLMSELPQGILSLLSALLKDDFYKECVNPLDEVIDLLALVNSATNFVLYCYMSQQFREALRRLLPPSRACSSWNPLPTSSKEQPPNFGVTTAV